MIFFRKFPCFTYYCSLLPQLPQNFVPGAFCVPQALHNPACTDTACIRLVPQLLQNRPVCAFFAPQEGHIFIAMDAPQLLQNLPLPAGFPQTGQIVVLLSILPVHTVAAAPASSILRRSASALALATNTDCLGAHSVQRPSSSFQQCAHTYLLQDGHF